MVHNPIIAFFLFLLGTIVGSFTNVLIWRIPRGESIVFPGSHCPKCGAKIKFYDNIPIISYIVLGGKCRNCGAKISPRYPFVEAFVGIAYLLTYLLYPADAYIPIIRMVLILPIFLAISWIDIEHLLIPDELTISVAVVGIVASFLYGGWRMLISSLIGAAIGIFAFWIISVLGKRAFHKEAMGAGDILLIGAIGLLVGWKNVLLVIFISAFLGAIGGVITVIMRKAISPKDAEINTAIPFGPFICAATIIVIPFGEKILDWYLKLFL